MEETHVVFDLHGVLVPLKSRRRGNRSQRIRVRHGVHHLRRLLPRYSVHVWSSAEKRNVVPLAAAVERAAGIEFGSVLCRDHTEPAPPSTRIRPWDTVKPLQKHFGHLAAVLLVDDGQGKVIPRERANLVSMDPWDGVVTDDDTVLERLVDALVAIPENADLRLHTAHVAAQLANRGHGGNQK